MASRWQVGTQEGPSHPADGSEKTSQPKRQESRGHSHDKGEKERLGLRGQHARRPRKTQATLRSPSSAGRRVWSAAGEGVFISQGRRVALPQAWRLQTTEIYSLLALEDRSPKPGCSHSHIPPEALRESPSRRSNLGVCWLRALLVAASSGLCPRLHMTYPMSCLLLLASRKDTGTWI